MIRGAAVYVALWTGRKLFIALGYMKFISLTFKSPFPAARTTYISTKVNQLILKGEVIVAFCENHRGWGETNSVGEMKRFFTFNAVKTFL
jgi:hypothetical protein